MEFELVSSSVQLKKELNIKAIFLVGPTPLTTH